MEAFDVTLERRVIYKTLKQFDNEAAAEAFLDDLEIENFEELVEDGILEIIDDGFEATIEEIYE